MTVRAQRGAALIIAMVIAALAAVVAMSLAANQQQWFASMTNRRDQVQAQALALAGVQWARQILFEDAKTTAIDTLAEPWAMPLPATPLENGSIEGSIIDAQGLLNVNNLAPADSSTIPDAERVRFARLFARLGVPPASLDAIADWIDADSTVREAGAEDAFYASQPVPGLAGDVPFIRIAEMASVKGVNARALDAVAPFLSALPAATPVNVNTAPPEVLATLVDGLDADRLAALVADRGPRPYPSIADFRSRLPNGATLASEAALSVKSGYFYVTVEARQGETIARARALLRRDPGTTTTVAWQVVE
jgi:general secretion pathway protein K